MALSPEHIQAQIIGMAREQASERLRAPLGRTEICGDTVVVRAGRKQVKYRILHGQTCDEHGVPYTGGDIWKLKELEVRTIPFWRELFGVMQRDRRK